MEWGRETNVDRNRQRCEIWVTQFNIPRCSAFQGAGQNCVLYRGFYYCQHINYYKNASRDQNLCALIMLKPGVL